MDTPQDPEPIPETLFASQADVLLIVCLVVGVGIATEIAGHYFVYHKEEYKDLIERTRNLGVRIKELKEQHTFGQANPTKRRQQEKMIKVQEQNYKDYHSQISALKWRFSMATGALSLITMWQVNSYCYAKVIATLPFEPWGMVSNLSHRGVPGDDMRQCSLAFIFVLLNLTFRGVFSKLFGSEAPRLP